MTQPPDAWRAEAQSLYLELGQRTVERRVAQANTDKLDRRIEELHVAISHLAETVQLATALVAAGAPASDPAQSSTPPRRSGKR